MSQSIKFFDKYEAINIDAASMNSSLIRDSIFTTTEARPISESLASIVKNADKFEYFTKHVVVIYPSGEVCATMCVNEVAVYHETFDHYRETGVYIGFPRPIIEAILSKLSYTGINVELDKCRLNDDPVYWWYKAGFEDANMEDKFISIVFEEDDQYEEVVFESFRSLFEEMGCSVVCDLIFNIKMSAKLEKAKNEKLDSSTIWKVGLSCKKFIVKDTKEDLKKPSSVRTTHKLSYSSLATTRQLERLSLEETQY